MLVSTHENWHLQYESPYRVQKRADLGFFHSFLPLVLHLTHCKIPYSTAAPKVKAQQYAHTSGSSAGSCFTFVDEVMFTLWKTFFCAWLKFRTLHLGKVQSVWLKAALEHEYRWFSVPLAVPDGQDPVGFPYCHVKFSIPSQTIK